MIQIDKELWVEPSQIVAVQAPVMSNFASMIFLASGAVLDCALSPSEVMEKLETAERARRTYHNGITEQTAKAFKELYK